MYCYYVSLLYFSPKKVSRFFLYLFKHIASLLILKTLLPSHFLISSLRYFLLIFCASISIHVQLHVFTTSRRSTNSLAMPIGRPSSLEPYQTYFQPHFLTLCTPSSSQALCIHTNPFNHKFFKLFANHYSFPLFPHCDTYFEQDREGE